MGQTIKKPKNVKPKDVNTIEDKSKDVNTIEDKSKDVNIIENKPKDMEKSNLVKLIKMNKSNLDELTQLKMKNLAASYGNTLETNKLYLHYTPKTLGNWQDKIDVNVYNPGLVLIKNFIRKTNSIFDSTFALLNDLNNIHYMKSLIIHGYVHPDFTSIFCVFNSIKFLYIDLAVFNPNNEITPHWRFFKQEDENDNDVNAKYIMRNEYEPFFNGVVEHSTAIFDETNINSSMNEETKKIHGLKYKLVKDLQFTKSTKGLERFDELEMLTIEHAIDLSWLTDISLLKNLKEIRIINSCVNMDELKFNKELLVIRFICCEIKNFEYWRVLSEQNNHMDICLYK